MTKANIITLLRILLVPIFIVILLTEMENKEIIAFVVFLFAAISDAFDGYIARKFDQVTDLGKFLDPIADKLLISAALVALVSLGEIETWAAAVIILRELFMTAFRFYFYMKEASFSASRIAKNKTLLQIIAISIFIIYRKLPYSDYIYIIGNIILYLAVFLTVYSAIEYVIKYSKVIKKQE